MYRFLYVVSTLATVFGVCILAQAPTITQQAAGLVVLLIAAVLFSGAAIVQAVTSLAPKVETLTPEELREKQVRELAESWNNQPPAATPES